MPVEVVAEIRPLDAATGTRPIIRLASTQDPRVTGLGGLRWWPAITRKPVLSHEFFTGDFITGDIRTGGASLSVNAQAMARLDPLSPGYRWAGCRIVIYAADTAQAWPWPVVFDGELERFRFQDATLTLEADVPERGFDIPVLNLAYQGTGGAEGGADLKNKPKPWALGYPKGLEPVLIDAINSVYQASAYGPVRGFAAVYERAASFGPSIGNFATYAALVAATIPPGRWASCIQQGMFRLGAPPAGIITCDLEADNQDGVWRRLPGAIVRRLLEYHGLWASRTVQASITALDTAVPYPISLYLDEQQTLLTLLQSIARTCNAGAGISWTGQIYVSRLAIGAPAATLELPARRRPAAIGLIEQPVRAPWTRIEMLADRCWRPHRPDEIAFFARLEERGEYEPLETYREGHIATRGGARWLYVNPTPTAGNAPPDWPTTSNAFWENLSPPQSITTSATGVHEGWHLHPDITSARREWSLTGPGSVALEGANPNLSGGVGLSMVGQVSCVGLHRIPYSYEDLYRVRARFYVNDSGSGNNTLLGVATLSSSGVSLPSDPGTHAFIGGVAPTPAAGSFYEWEGFFRGRAIVGAGNNVGVPAPDPSVPRPLPSNTVSIAPVFLANFGGTGGVTLLEWIEITKVEDLTALPTRAWLVGDFQARGQVVTYLGRSWIARVDNIGIPPPATATGNATWGLLADKGANGLDGNPGLSVAEMTIYRRSATPPANPSGGTFNFGTQVLSPPSGWSSAPPAPDGNPLYLARGIASLVGVTGSATPSWSPATLSIADAESVRAIYRRENVQPATPGPSTGTPAGWSATVPGGSDLLWVSFGARASSVLNFAWQTPVRVQGGDGIDGVDGTLKEFVWRRATVLPVTPTGNGIPSGWFDNPPGGTDPLWMSVADQELDGTLIGVWSTPIRHDGPPGVNGGNTAQVLIYQRAVSAPAAPAATVTYTFATGAITGLDSGWLAAPPPVNGNPLWVRTATAFAAAASDTIASGEWSGASKLVEDGATGPTGLNSAPVFIYQRAAAAPAAPSENAIYTFATGGIAGLNNGWSATIPAATGQPLWVRTASASGTGTTDIIAPGEWAAAQKLAENGADGITQGPVAPIQVAAFSNGNIKADELPQTRQLALTQGTTNVTGSATWAVQGTPVNLTISINTGGLVTVTGLSADSGSAVIRGTLAGASFDFNIVASKVKDGTAALGVSAALSFPSGSTLTILGTTADLALPAGMAVNVSMTASWESVGGSAIGDFIAQYSTDGGGSWTTMGGSTTASAIPFEPAFLSLTRGLAASGAARLVRFRIQGSITNIGNVVGDSITPLFASAA